MCDWRSTSDAFTENCRRFVDVLPKDIAEDVRGNTRVMVQSALEKMDLVSREELDVQEKVLQRTREKLEALEVRITELEQKLHTPSD